MPRLSARDIHRLSPEARKQIRRALRSSDGTRASPLPHPEKEPTPSKYRNIRTTVDGISFASQREANRYAELKLELMAGEISDLALQQPFLLDVNGIHICDYVADPSTSLRTSFVYRRNGQMIVEDAKGKATDLFVIKRALMRAVHGIQIVEV